MEYKLFEQLDNNNIYKYNKPIIRFISFDKYCKLKQYKRHDVPLDFISYYYKDIDGNKYTIEQVLEQWTNDCNLLKPEVTYEDMA